ncbi:MAG: hypothetical protein KDA44_16875 [Planctomycetales bacterium]|nr:hypothetical protein [Planctomycetales bacterium]
MFVGWRAVDAPADLVVEFHWAGEFESPERARESAHPNCNCRLGLRNGMILEVLDGRLRCGIVDFSRA